MTDPYTRNLQRHKELKAPLVGGSPYALGKARLTGWEPPAAAAESIPFLQDEVYVREDEAATKKYDAAAAEVYAGLQGISGIHSKFETIFVTDSSGMSNFDRVFFPWIEDVWSYNTIWAQHTKIEVNAGLYVNLLLNADLLDSDEAMYYQDATWNTHNYDYEGAAHGTVLYADADDYDDNGGDGYRLGHSFEADEVELSGGQVYIMGNGLGGSSWDGMAGLYFSTAITGPVYGFHIYMAAANPDAGTDSTHTPAGTSNQNFSMYRTFDSTKPDLNPNYRRGFAFPTSLNPS